MTKRQTQHAARIAKGENTVVSRWNLFGIARCCRQLEISAFARGYSVETMGTWNQ